MTCESLFLRVFENKTMFLIFNERHKYVFHVVVVLVTLFYRVLGTNVACTYCDNTVNDA